MDLIVNEMLLDCLNLAKVVFKNGLTGTIILGDKYQKIFTALPEYFTMTDHDIRIITSTDIVKDLEQIKNIIPEFVKSGGLPPDIIIEAVTSKSLPDLKYKVRKAMQIQKDENNQIQQLSQQNQQLQQQLQEMQKQLQESQRKVESLNQTSNLSRIIGLKCIKLIPIDPIRKLPFRNRREELRLKQRSWQMEILTMIKLDKLINGIKN